MALHIGYHVHQVLTYQRPYSAEDKAKLWAHLDKIQPSALLFLNNVDDAWQAKSRYPSCVVVHRSHYSEEGGLYKTISPQQFYDRHAAEGHNGVVVNCLNEPSGYLSSDEHKRMAGWCADVMGLFGKAGIPVVTPNWGVGHPQENSYADFNELWDAFKAWPLHYLGAHEYWSYKGIEAGNGRVGRFLWWVAYLRNKGYPYPNIIFTEWGLDDLLDGSGKRGWKDSRTEKEYAAECLEAARRYYDFSYVKGVCTYSWGNSGRKDTAEDWITHDVSDAMEFQAMIEQELTTPVVPARKYEPGKDYVYTGANSFNIRNLPSTAITTVVKGQLKKDDRVRFANVDAVSADGHVWQQGTVYKEGNLEIAGWLAVGIIPLEEKQDAPPDEPPAPIALFTRAELVRLAELDAQIATLTAERAAIWTKAADKAAA